MSETAVPQKIDREGWIDAPEGKWHYVIGIDALCGTRIPFGQPEQGDDGSPWNCAICKQKVQERHPQ